MLLIIHPISSIYKDDTETTRALSQEFKVGLTFKTQLIQLRHVVIPMGTGKAFDKVHNLLMV